MKTALGAFRYGVGLAVLASTSLSQGQVVINEFLYDDASTDDREFVELFNKGTEAVNIGGWSIGGRDATGANLWVNVNADTILAPGGYYVVGMAGVANVNQTTTSWLENDAEQLELWNGASGSGTLVDGVIYEASRGTTSHGTVSADMLAQTGPGYWGNYSGTDVAGTPLVTTQTTARHYDGYDTGNNGRNFGIRPATPGAPNSTVRTSAYRAPNVDSLANGASVPGFTGSFVNARVMTPTVVTAGLNPNAIPAAPNSAKAIVAWDGSGGGNTVVSDATFDGSVSYDIVAYFDTRNNPLSSNASGVNFRGSEETIFGLGGGDASSSLINLSGAVGSTGVGQNGSTGVAWYYEKVGETATGNGIVSEKLYLIDANDGGNSNVSDSALGWTILQEIDLSTVDSGWFRLGLAVDAEGNGIAIFGDQTFTFTTDPGLVGEFYVGYRENTQAGAVTVPDYLRPPTWVPTSVPEPSSLALGLLGLGSLWVARKRR